MASWPQFHKFLLNSKNKYSQSSLDYPGGITTDCEYLELQFSICLGSQIHFLSENSFRIPVHEMDERVKALAKEYGGFFLMGLCPLYFPQLTHLHIWGNRGTSAQVQGSLEHSVELTGLDCRPAE